ncbi:hypothetical protein AGMMS49965_08430 [Bacteroidia bacterium]|nr:hypothetical protein AGMMS49965_08430 [Bacteroidia bacterium]
MLFCSGTALAQTTYSFSREAKTGGRIIDESSTPSGENYPAGTVITVNAEASQGYKFIGWRDADYDELFVTTRETYSTKLTKDLTLTAHFLPLFTVTAISSDEAMGTVSSLSSLPELENGTYPIKDFFTADHKPGYTFVKWTYEGSDETIEEFTIDKASVVLVAHFVQLFIVTATSNDVAMGTVSLPSSQELKNGTYPIKDFFTATANFGYIPVKWTYKDSDVAIKDFIIDNKAPVELVAHFAEDNPNTLFPVNATSNDATMGTVFPSSRELESGTYPIEIFTAIHEPGYILDKWTHKGSDDAITEFTINKELVELVAHFVPNLFTVNAASNDETMGTVSPSLQELENGTHLIKDYFIATHELGYIFDKWTYKDSDDAITDSSFTINKAQVELVAHFVIDPNCISFEQIGDVRYNNVLMINIDLETIEDIKWFRDDEVIGTEWYYSAGDRHDDELNENAEYRVEITTSDGRFLHTCPRQMPLRSTNFSSPLQAFPNPVKKGSLITIEGIPKEVGSIIIYDIAGRVAARHDPTVLRNASETIPMPATEGIYLIKVGEKTLKVVVE